MNTNLYNNDGTLSSQAQLLLSPKPDDMSIAEWRKFFKEFRSQLSEEDIREFNRLKIKTRAIKYAKAYYQRNKEKARARQIQNKEEQRAYQRAYRQKNKENVRAYARAYDKDYRQKLNKEERRAYMAEYNRNRRQKDPLYNFFHSIRSQAVRVVKQVGLGKKPANTFKWVGCSPEELKAHVESLFKEGMTWDNYGRYGWHVDHIRPVASFKPEEWEQINHYTNLQPLWWQDNISKSDKLQD